MIRWRVHFVFNEDAIRNPLFVDVIARDEFHARHCVKLQGYHDPVRMVERNPPLDIERIARLLGGTIRNPD